MNEIQSIVNSFGKLIDSGDLAGINEKLSKLDFKNMTIGGIMSAMRTTYQWRGGIICWNSRLIDAQNEIDLKGGNAKQVLQGLFPDKS